MNFNKIQYSQKFHNSIEFQTDGDCLKTNAPVYTVHIGIRKINPSKFKIKDRTWGL